MTTPKDWLFAAAIAITLAFVAVYFDEEAAMHNNRQAQHLKNSVTVDGVEYNKHGRKQ